MPDSLQLVSSESELDALYGEPAQLSLDKVANTLTPQYRRWIEASRFLVLASVGPEGTDLSPRGDMDPVVRIRDNQSFLIPDWLGNNRLDTLRNIVRDQRVSVMFMVPGSNNVVRVNGAAVITIDPALLASFEHKGKQPRSVIVITIDELYFQCAKALMRSELWSSADLSKTVPSAGDFLREAKEGFDGASYDAEYPTRLEERMW
jgi:PPOX class probable FMN-dependent enzyme